MDKTMTTSAMTDKQIERAVEIFRAQLRKHASGLPSDAVQKVFGQTEFGKELITVLRKRLEMFLVLAPRGLEEITLTEHHDPNLFYNNRPGLFVWNDFCSRIVVQAKPSKAGTTFKVNAAELMRDLIDEEIEVALPKDHLFDETSVCAVIAGLIAKQPNGEKGALVNNGRANLFYTCSCVVSVYWDAVGREWRVGTWQRDGGRWLAGRRAFSPAN